MSLRLYKSIRLGKGVRINLSKTGVGISAGIPGLRYSVHSSGRTVKTAGIPGTGVYYRKDSRIGAGASVRSGGARTSTAPVAPVVQMPHAGLFAPKEDKLFVQGVRAYMSGNYAGALKLLQDVQSRDGAQRHVGEELFAAICLVALERPTEAIEALETVLASASGVPDELMKRYNVDGQVRIGVTPTIEVLMPISNQAVILMLAEIHQNVGNSQKAIELLESAGSVTKDPFFALSAAELYTEAGKWNEVLRVTRGFTTNEDDVTAQMLVFRAQTLMELEKYDAAIGTCREALRFKKRQEWTLLAARYVRADCYEKQGKKAMARKDLERIYAIDPDFRDVGERLGLTA